MVVALKEPGCPVCHDQLRRIRERLPQLAHCQVQFVVLSPGPRERLEALRKKSGFPYPFVEDVDLAIAERLGLRMAPGKIQPSILVVAPDLSIRWEQRGRNGSYFGDPELLSHLRCEDWI